MKKTSRVTHFDGKKRVRKHAGFKDIAEVQLKPTALEVINYKTGAQGSPENVEAFEREVVKQSPSTHLDVETMSSQQLFAEYEAAKPGSKTHWIELWVRNMLKQIRVPQPTRVKKGKPEKKLLGLGSGDFSQTTINWFNDHPADLIWLSSEERNTEAKKWAGFKGGVKSKGGGRPKKYHTPLEKKKAKAEAQKKRAAEARGK